MCTSARRVSFSRTVGRVARQTCLSAIFLLVATHPAYGARYQCRISKAGPPGGHERSRSDWYGDPLPAGAVCRMGTLRFWMGVPIGSVTFTPDGKAVAASADGGSPTVPIWDAATGRVVRSFPPPGWHKPEGFYQIGHVAFSPDGKSLAVGGGESIVIWEPVTGRTIRVLKGHEEGVSRLIFARGGTALASTGADQALRIWNLETGDQAGAFPLTGQILPSITLSPDGLVWAAGWEDGTIRFWDVLSGKSTRRLHAQVPAYVNAFAPDGKTLTSLGRDGAASVWNLATGKEVRRVHLQGWTLSRSTVLSPDRKMAATGCYDATIRVWDLISGAQIRRIDLGPWNIPRVISFSPDGRTIASAAGDGTILRLWDLATGAERGPRPTHEGGVVSVAVSPDGKSLASTGSDVTLRIWDTATGREALRILDGPRGVWHVPMEKDDRLMLLREVGPTGEVTFSADVKIALSPGRDGTLRFWDVAKGSVLRETRLERCGRINAVAFDPDAKRVAAVDADSGSLAVWDAASGKQTFQIATLHEGTVRDVAFAPDSKTVATAGDDGSVKIWDAAAPRLLESLALSRESLQCVCFSPDGDALCAGGLSASLKVWRRGEREIQASACPGEPGLHIIRCAKFSPDGNLVAWGGDDCVLRVWDVKKARGIVRFEGHRGAIRRIAFTRKSASVISGSDDGTILIWDLSSLPEEPERGRKSQRGH